MADIDTLTDPATELVELCEFLRSGYNLNDNKPRFQALSTLFKCEPNDPLFAAIVSALAARFDRLRRIIDNIPHFQGRERNRALGAVDAVRQLTAIDQISRPWSEVGTGALNDAHLGILQMLAPLLRSSHPLRRLSDSELKDLLTHIDEQIAELVADEKIDGTIRHGIEDSLGQLKAILERFRFFGVEHLTEKLSSTHVALSALSSAAPDTPSAGAVRRAAKIIAGIVAALVVFDKPLSAIEHHIARGNQLLTYLSAEYRGIVEALPAPSSALSSPESEEEAPIVEGP